MDSVFYILMTWLPISPLSIMIHRSGDFPPLVIVLNGSKPGCISNFISAISRKKTGVDLVSGLMRIQERSLIFNESFRPDKDSCWSLFDISASCILIIFSKASNTSLIVIPYDCNFIWIDDNMILF